jgi:hypothetical protein
MVDMGNDAEISDMRDGHGQSVNINEARKGVNLSMFRFIWVGMNKPLPDCPTATNFFKDYMSEQEKPPGLPKYWIWILIIFLGILLLVPVLSIGTAIQKTGWVPVKRILKPKAQVSEAQTAEEEQVAQNSMSLRERVEKIAATAIKIPKLQPKMKQVKIETQPATPNMKQAADSIHRVLLDQNIQFVEAVDSDRIRIVAVLDGSQWPKLSGSLEVASAKDGLVYRGPSQTASAGLTGAMVAEIEILKHKTPASKQPGAASPTPAKTKQG